jgi:hypothetical protein
MARTPVDLVRAGNTGGPAFVFMAQPEVPVAGLIPATHVFRETLRRDKKSWKSGTSPAKGRVPPELGIPAA